MTATKETVLEHLRALGYEGDDISNVLSESFIVDCVTELNAMSYSSLSDYYANSASQTSQQRRPERAGGVMSKPESPSTAEIDANEVEGSAEVHSEEYSHDSDALFVQQLLKDFGDNLDGFKDVEYEDAPVGLSSREWIGNDPINIGQEAAIPSPWYSNSRSKYLSLASNLIPDPYSLSQRDEGYEQEWIVEREKYAESNRTNSVPSPLRETSALDHEMASILQEYHQRQHFYKQESHRGEKDSDSESDVLNEECKSGTSSPSEPPQQRHRTPTGIYSVNSYLVDPQHSLPNAADNSMSVIERLANLDLSRLHAVIREQKLKNSILKAGLSSGATAGAKSNHARNTRSTSAPPNQKQPALPRYQLPYHHKLERNIAKPVVKYTQPSSSTPPLWKSARAELHAIDGVNMDYEGSFVNSERPVSRSTAGFIKANRPPAPRKADPVARFHAHQRVWKNDDFLARRQSKPKPTHSSAPSTTVGGRQRHNLAAMRPTYVIPSEKLRRDVVWETRSRLARIG